MEEMIRALPELLRAAGETDEVLEAVAFVAWRRAAGVALYEHAVPFRLYRKTLTVAVRDATWQKQLEAMSGQLLFRINSLLSQAVVTYIEFRIDTQTVERDRAHRHRTTFDRKTLQARALRSAEEVREAANAIRDESLRQCFLRAAGSCIARRREDGNG
ncbi:MAG: hypothetical protein NVSMB56_09320 [Pyrinomonadaceae bacterium]